MAFDKKTFDELKEKLLKAQKALKDIRASHARRVRLGETSLPLEAANAQEEYNKAYLNMLRFQHGKLVNEPVQILSARKRGGKRSLLPTRGLYRDETTPAPLRDIGGTREPVPGNGYDALIQNFRQAQKEFDNARTPEAERRLNDAHANLFAFESRISKAEAKKMLSDGKERVEKWSKWVKGAQRTEREKAIRRARRK